jgi:hypothetical protein
VQKTILIAALLAATTPARAEIINLSCDDGGMLLVIDTDKATVTDKNPFQKTAVTAALTVTETAFTWREGKPGAGAHYTLDKASRKVAAMMDGANDPEPATLSNPQCGKSAVLLPKK